MLDRGNREAVQDQSRGIIGEALTFEHDQEPARQAQPPGDGQGCDHIGWRHNGAEHEGDGKRDAEQPMDGDRHRTGGEDDAAERQERDRAQVEPEFTPAHGDASRIDQRWQDAEQDQFRR